MSKGGSFAAQKVTTISLLCLAILTLIYPIFVLLNLGNGLDLTDTGYYYLVLQNEPGTVSGPTQFGLIWSLLPFPENIHFNRFAIFGLLCFAGAILANRLCIQWNQREIHAKRAIAILAGIGAISTFYTWWLPDPSYNSMALVLIPIVIVVVLILTEKLSVTSKVPKVTTIGIGALLLALGLARPQSALVMSLVFIPFVLLTAKPSWKQIFQLAGLILIGSIGLVIFLSIFVEPFSVSWQRGYDGFIHRNMLEIRNSPSVALTVFWRQALTSIIDHWLWITFLAISLTLGTHAQLFFSKNIKNIKFFADLLACALILASGALFINSTLALKKYSIEHVAHFTFPLMIAILFAVLASILLRVFTKRRDNIRRELVLLVIAAGLVAQVIFTANHWLKFSGWFAFYPLIATFFYFGWRGKTETHWTLVSPLALILVVQFSAYKQSSEKPYGLRTSLNSQTIPMDIRFAGNEVKLDPATHEFLSAFSGAKNKIESLEHKPVIIDMTGMFPMLIYHIGGKSTRWPWLMAGRPGSNNMFTASIDSLDQELLGNAWIIYSPDWQRGHDMDYLKQKGIDIQNDYALEAKVYVRYMRSDVRLLSPKRPRLEQIKLP